MAQAKLIIHSPGKPPQEVAVDGAVSIGRAAQNVIQLEAAGIADYHVTIEVRAGRCWLSHLGLAELPLVNGEPLNGEHILKDGDRILLGDATQLEFRSEATQPLTREAANISSKQDLASKAATGSRKPLVATLLIAAFIVVIVAAKGLRPDGHTEPTPVPTPRLPESPTPPREEMPNVEVVRALLDRFKQGIATRHTFEPDLVNEIARRIPAYTPAMIEAGQPFGRAICWAFATYQGVPAKLGIALALSRSRFQSTVMISTPPNYRPFVDFWKLPQRFLDSQSLPVQAANEKEAVEQAAGLAAQYVKELRGEFRYADAFDDYVYLVACFDCSREQVLKVDAELRQPLAEPYNFWRMRRKLGGQLPANATERVADFFAAGLAGFYHEELKLNVTGSFIGCPR